MNKYSTIGRQFTLFAAVFLPAAVAAQKKPAAVDAGLIRPGTDTIAVTVEAQGRIVPVATALRSLRRVQFRGSAAIEMTYQWHGNDGSSTADTLWVDARTLAPIENHRHNGMQDAVTTFERNSAHTRFIAKGKREQRTDTTTSEALFASGELEDLIRLAPLSPGYRGSYTLYYGPPGRLARSATFAVVRSETVKGLDGKPAECWVVDAPLSEGLNTFFIRKTDRRVVRLVNHEDPSAAFVFAK